MINNKTLELSVIYDIGFEGEIAPKMECKGLHSFNYDAATSM